MAIEDGGWILRSRLHICIERMNEINVLRVLQAGSPRGWKNTCSLLQTKQAAKQRKGLSVYLCDVWVFLKQNKADIEEL